MTLDKNNSTLNQIELQNETSLASYHLVITVHKIQLTNQSYNLLLGVQAPKDSGLRLEFLQSVRTFMNLISRKEYYCFKEGLSVKISNHRVKDNKWTGPMDSK